jgi:hypothetical protein
VCYIFSIFVVLAVLATVKLKAYYLHKNNHHDCVFPCYVWIKHQRCTLSMYLDTVKDIF